MGWNLPDGCSVGDIPGFRPIDAKYDDAEERLEKMFTEEVIILLENMFSQKWLLECFNEALEFEELFKSYDHASEHQLKVMVEYILGFKRDEVLTHIVEGG